MYFRNYGRQKMWLDKCLKSPISDDPLTGNMVNRPRFWFSLNASSFTIFVDHCGGNWVGKSCFSDMQSLKTFCYHLGWLPTASIVFLVETTQWKQFRRIYWKNEKTFINFCVLFSNLKKILNIFKKRWFSQLKNFRN